MAKDIENIKIPRVLPHHAIFYAASIVYSNLNAGVHKRTGEQISKISHPCDPASGEGE